MSIDVRVQHPGYKAQQLSIMAARDCFLGERAVKARSDLYLPRLSGQKVEDYHAYKNRATFYSIVGRTVSALTGLAVQGDVAVTGNEETLAQMEDSEHGMQLFESNNQTVTELLLQGRYGILLDSPEESRSVGLYGYVSDAIINWKTDGAGRYIMVVLEETRLVNDISNPYKMAMESQYRVLEMIGGVYTQMLYDKDSKPISTRITPTFSGRPLTYIPFYSALPDGVRAGVGKSPMDDLVNINLSHYRTSADLENGRHYTGLPTPVVSGAEVSGKLKVGSQNAWVLPDKDAKAYFLEFKGEGLKSLENALKEKEAQLSSLSSSIISRSVKGSESPDAIRMRLSSETASLFTIVKTVQTLQNIVWNTKSELEGNARDINLTYPTQFVSGQITADEVQKYSKVFIEGGLPIEDYVAILRRGGALSAGRKDDDVKTELEALAKERLAAEKQKQTPTQP